MTYDVYAMKDELTNMFFWPMYFKSEAEAKRYFKTKMNDNPDWKYNSTDYAFYRLGTFNDETGEYISQVSKEINGRSVIDE